MAILLSRASSLPNSLSHLSIFNRSLHTNSSFLSLLQFCRKTRDLKALNSILIVNGLIRNESLLHHFIHRCCRLGFPNLALPSFKTIHKPSLYLQNLLLRSFCDNRFFEDVIFIYKKCHHSGTSSDNYTFPFVIKASAAARDYRFGNVIHCVVIKTGFRLNLIVQTAILDFYFKTGDIRNACKVFGEIPQPDLIVWNAMISGYSVNAFDYEAFRVFGDMLMKSVTPNASTLATVLPVCCRVEGVDRVGICLHGLAYKLGCVHEGSLLPALISMYANRCDVLAAEEIFFDSSFRKDVAIWNAMISTFTRSHLPEHAVGVFRELLVGGEVKPDAVTFVSLLPSSESIRCVESFHACVCKFGVEKEPSVVTALVSVYAKLGNLDSAEFLFHEMKVRNLLLWNSMVSARAGHGLCEESLEAFRLMQEDDFDPDAISIVSLLTSCSRLKATVLGKSAHAFAIRKSIDTNLQVLNAFLAFYFDCSELVYSFKIFDRIVIKSVVSWNTMISGCIDKGELEKGMLFFHQMMQEGFKYDLVTLISILPSCHMSRGSLLGSSIHGYAIKTSLKTDISLANALVTMYVNCGELHAARLFFDEMLQKDVVSWNAILTGYRLLNVHKESIKLFGEMMEEDQRPSYVTLLNVLPACEDLRQGKSFHGYIVRREIPLETRLVTSLMIMYARFTNLKSCLNLFHTGDKTSISIWNTIISAYLLIENGNMAFSFFAELLARKIKPDDITILNLISAAIHLKNLKISNSVLAYGLKQGFDKDAAISNSLIDMYAKCGSISSSRTLFDSLQDKDGVSYSVMINAYGLHGCCEGALSLYSEMRNLGLKPDGITYTSILSACSHAGCVEEGRMVFESIMGDGMQPWKEHYSCMVDLLGRAGELVEAYEIVRNMPHQPSGNILGCLLGACLNHGNYQLGEEVGRILVELEIEDCGCYVILHNIYAAAGKWGEANNVRMLLERNQFSKAPGISLLVC